MKLSAYGLCVRKLRLEHGLTLRDMAEVLEVSSPYLSSIELGERSLTQKLAAKTIAFLSPKLSQGQLEELELACDKSMKTIAVSTLNPDGKNLVAAFARRLSEGQGVPEDVMKWLKGDRVDDSKRKKR
jgi:transcriptional regulator with XRE-family HTH domain